MLSNVQDLDLKLLRMFRTVARHGGFVAAQVELNLSLPTISNQIKQLEERLGVRLCDRGALGFRLTGEGEGLLKAADELFGAVDSFRAEVADLARAPVGEIKLGIVDNLTTDPACHVPEAIRAMHLRVPGAAIRFFIGPPSELESQVLGGALDLAIGLFPEPPAALESVRLFAEEHVLYCADGHPLFAATGVAAADLAAHPYVSWAYQEAYVAAPPADFHTRSSTPFMEALVYLVLSGVYIGYLPRHSAERWVRTGRLRPLLEDAGVRHVPVTLISRRSQRPNKIVAACKAEIERAHGVGVGA
jgi:DNA-binding transcriptional LysR family regulator